MVILMAKESIILEEEFKFIILSDCLSTIKSIQSPFEPGDVAIQVQNKLNKAAERGKQKTILITQE